MEKRAREVAREYPRPPSIRRESMHVRGVLGGKVIADTLRPIVIRETTHAPAFYVPLEDVDASVLRPSAHTTFCEYKGLARYYSVEIDGHELGDVAWYYPEPTAGYEEMADHVAFYAWALDEATVDGEQVEPQPGRFYGGWVTSWVEGPFKGAPGTWGW